SPACCSGALGVMPRFSVKPPLTSSRRYVFGDPRERGNDVAFLGRLAEAGQSVDVHFDVSGEFVIAIFGKRGSGKSYCLGDLLESFCSRQRESSAGISSRTRAVLVFDTLNIFWSLDQPLRVKDREAFPEEWAKLQAWGLKPIETDVA